MRDRRLDSLFDRFRRRGDVQALGTIFDAVAPELLGVAMSLVRDANEADDLLQETFLTAIERAGRYDASRRLVPWLLGILVHHARERRRDRQRPLDPGQLHQPTSSGPEEAALGRELEHAFERAFAELSSRDRTVLDAHLRQGKGAAEIAAEVGAAPGAVRMQIHRGLDRLRRALPAGLALGAAGGALNARGLTAVRATVLRAGSEATARLVVGTASALGGLGLMGLLMSKKLILTGVLAALLASLYFLSVSGERAPAPFGEVAHAESDRTPVRRTALAPLAAPTEIAPAEGQGGQREAVAASALARDPDHADLRGRLVEHDGAPVSGTSVALLELDEAQLFPSALESSGRAPATPAIPRLLAASAVTDGRGVFVLPGAAVRTLHALGIDLGGERSTLRVLDAICRPGETTDLGDIVLTATGAVSGRVIDGQGRPVAGARVRIGALSELLTTSGMHEIVAGGALGELTQSGFHFFLELPPWLAWLESKLPLATTSADADGRFALARVAAGRLTAVVDVPGRTPVAAQKFELGAGTKRDLGDLVLTSGAEVRGRVLDALGASVPDAEVRVGSTTGSEVAVLGPVQVTDGEGRFACEGASEEGTRVVCARRGPLGSWVRGEEQGGEFVVTLGAEQELEVAVVDGDGRPVPAPEILVRSFGQSTNDMGVFQPAPKPVQAELVDAASGRWRVGRFGAGRYAILARAEGLAPASATVQIEADALAPLRIVLNPTRRTAVLVLDAATREPVAGARVRFESLQAGPPELLVRGESDRDGRLVLDVPVASGGAELALRIEHPRFAPKDVRLSPDVTSLSVELTQGARLVARLPAGMTERPSMLLLTSHGSEPAFRMPLLYGFSSGVADVARLPAGKWSWALLDSLAGAEALLFLSADRTPEEHASGEFTLVEGETFELAIADTAPAAVVAEVGPGNAVLTGFVRVEGRAVRDLQINLCPLDSQCETMFDEVAEGGHFRFEGVVPGRYFLFIDSGGRGPDEEASSLIQEQLELAPHEQRDLDYDLHPHSVDLRVVAADGKTPVPDASCALLPEEGGIVTTGARTDRRGRASIEVTRNGRFVLSVVHPEEGAGRAHFEVGPDGVAEEILVTLTKGVECSGVLRLAPGFSGASGTPSAVTLHVHAGSGPFLMKECEVELEAGAGAFRLVGLEPGEYGASVSIEGTSSLKQTFQLPEWGSSTLELEFAPDKRRDR